MRAETPESSSKRPISNRIQCLLVAFAAIGLGTVSLKVLSQESEHEMHTVLEVTQKTTRTRAHNQLTAPHTRAFSGEVSQDQESTSSEEAPPQREQPIAQSNDSRTPEHSPGETTNNQLRPNTSSANHPSRNGQSSTAEVHQSTMNDSPDQLKDRLALLLSAETLDISQITAILDRMTTTTTQYDQTSALKMLSGVLSVLEDPTRWTALRNTQEQKIQLIRSLNFAVTELTRGQPPILVGQDVMAIHQRVQRLESESRSVRIVNQLNVFLLIARTSLRGDTPQYIEVFRQSDFVNLVTLLSQLREDQDPQFRPLAENVLGVLWTLKTGTDLLPPQDPLRRSLDLPGDAENPNPYRLEPKIAALEQLLAQ